MSTSVIYILIAIALLICATALVFIKHHYGVINAAKKSQSEAKEKLQKRYEEQRAYLVESVQVIAKAVGSDDKLSHTEACMRLAALLKSLAPQLLENPDFSVILEVYKRTEHIPILGEWKQLSKQQQWKFKQEMLSVEQQFGSRVEAAAERLARYDFQKLSH